jgi:hypothetical protein
MGALSGKSAGAAIGESVVFSWRFPIHALRASIHALRANY